MTRSLQFCIAGFLDFSSTRGMALPFRIKFAVLAALMVPPGRTPPGTDGLGLATKTPGIVDGYQKIHENFFFIKIGDCEVFISVQIYPTKFNLHYSNPNLIIYNLSLKDFLFITYSF